jgi:uncharacterized protein YndB with AHSA1/START domain
MTSIERDITIDAAPEAVFKELIDLHRLDRWSTITVSHDGPDTPVTAGDQFTQKLRIAGIPLDSEWRCTECEPPNTLAYEATATGGGRLAMRQVVTPEGTGSRLVFSIDYDLPGGALGDLVDRLYVERRNEREAEHSLQNLKDLIEGRPTT